jgi:tetratricopeptide (TPR) repeat protein
MLTGVDSVEAASQRALLTGWYATILQAEGRTRAAIRLGHTAVAESKDADNLDALARAYFVLGWAYGVLGRPEGREYWERSLEVYRETGDLVKQADLLSNLGTLAFWEGRWDDAMENWAGGRDQSLKIGDVVGAAASADNIAELLINRGEFDRAEEILLESLPLWQASEYRYFLGNCLGMLGRLLSRTGRFEEALSRFEEARTRFLHVGAEQEILDLDTRAAECRVLMGDADAALEIVSDTLTRAAASDDGGAMIVPALQRARAYAYLQRGDQVAAQLAWTASLDAARARSDPFEAMLTALVPIRLALFERRPPDADLVREVQESLDALAIRAVPAVPIVGR